MNSDSNDTAFLRHLLKTIQYRLGGVLIDPPAGFGTFAMDAGARTPVQLLSHISDVLAWAHSKVDRTRARFEATDSWEAQVDRFRQILSAFDEALATREVSPELALRLTQGPLADVLTHVGQLALIRRLAGAPIPGENFFAATVPDIEAAT